MTRKGTDFRNPRLRIGRRIFVLTLGAILLVWFIGLLQFVNAIARASPDHVARTDAVVVLTGGAKRLTAAFNQLISQRARRMLVSGVNTDVTHEQLRQLVADNGLEVPSELFECCVELGFQAKDTRGNAKEAAEWAKQHSVRSLLLVTSNYHMARSLVDFGHAMPTVKIEVFPVVADNVVLDRWWRWPGSIQLLVSEYSKFILTQFRSIAITRIQRLTG